MYVRAAGGSKYGACGGACTRESVPSRMQCSGGEPHLLVLQHACDDAATHVLHIRI